MDSRNNNQDEKSIAAEQLFTDLIKHTNIPRGLNDTTSKVCRDRCLDALTQARLSTHFNDISEKLASGQALLDNELLYYVISVDDVNNLDENVFG